MLTPTEAHELLGSPFSSEDLGLNELPLAVIDLRGANPDEPTERLQATIATAPVVVVAVVSTASPEDLSPLARACDVVLTTADSPAITLPRFSPAKLDALAASVRAHPIAAVTLVETLRLSEHTSVWNALVAESLAYSTLLAGAEFDHWLNHQAPAQRPESRPDPKVRTRHEGTHLHITLDDPARRNAMSAGMRDELVTALRVAATDSSIATVTLDGEGPSFCSGGDLYEFGSTPDAATAHQVRIARSTAHWLHLCDAAKPVTAFVHGHAIGAGVELAAFATKVVAHPDTLFALPEVAMGLIPGAGGTVSLARRIGRHRTAWMALSGENVAIAQAIAWGLVDTVQTDYPQPS